MFAFWVNYSFNVIQFWNVICQDKKNKSKIFCAIRIGFHLALVAKYNFKCIGNCKSSTSANNHVAITSVQCDRGKNKNKNILI